MIPDIVQALTLVTGGLLLISAAGVRSRLLRFGLAPLVGVAILVVVGVGFSVVTVRFVPAVVLGLVVLLPGVLYFLARRKGAGEPIRSREAIVLLVATAAVAAACSALARVNYHNDSFEYLTIGAQLVQGTLLDAISYFQLEKRMFAVGVLHATAIASGETYSLGAMPFVAVSLLGGLGALLFTGLKKGGASQRVSIAVTAVSVCSILVMNRFVWNAFYVNGHLLFAALLVGVVGLAWLRSLDAVTASRFGVTAVQWLLIAALVLTRPDSSFAAILAIVPVLVDQTIDRRERGALLWAVGAPLLAWEGFIILVGHRVGAEPTISMIGLSALAVFLLVSPLLLRWDWLFRRPLTLVACVEATLWVVLGILVLRNPEILAKSVAAFAANVLLNDASWGPSIVLLLILVTLALALVRAPDRLRLRFPVTTFVPLVFLLAYLRDSPYRIAEADSLNRMVIQVVPLMVFLVASSAIGVWRTRLSEKATARPTEVPTAGAGTTR